MRRCDLRDSKLSFTIPTYQGFEISCELKEFFILTIEIRTVPFRKQWQTSSYLGTQWPVFSDLLRRLDAKMGRLRCPVLGGGGRQWQSCELYPWFGLYFSLVFFYTKNKRPRETHMWRWDTWHGLKTTGWSINRTKELTYMRWWTTWHEFYDRPINSRMTKDQYNTWYGL